MASLLHSLTHPKKKSAERIMGPCYLCEKKTRSHPIVDKILCHTCYSGKTEDELKALEQRIVVGGGHRKQKKLETMETLKSMRRPVEVEEVE